MKKRILFEIAHPKHFHQFKYLIHTLENDYTVKIIARDKDVVIDLLEAESLPYVGYGLHGKSMPEKFAAVPAILYQYWKIVNKFKPDLIISRSSPYAAIVSKFKDFKTLILPDSEVVTFNNNFVVPLSDIIITPSTYTLDHGENHFRVKGFFESAYLHPHYFEPDASILSDLEVQEDEPFFLIRLVGWFANHDTGNHGFSEEQKIKLVNFLSDRGKVFISGEVKLSDNLKPYQLNIKPNKMHSLLKYCSLYIGDSQTMATEAALLGTPAVRYNSFVGKNDMSNFKILESEYDLLNNVSSFTEVRKVTKRILSRENIKEEFKSKRKRYFDDTGDVNKETESIINNYLLN